MAFRNSKKIDIYQRADQATFHELEAFLGSVGDMTVGILVRVPGNNLTIANEYFCRLFDIGIDDAASLDPQRISNENVNASSWFDLSKNQALLESIISTPMHDTGIENLRIRGRELTQYRVPIGSSGACCWIYRDISAEGDIKLDSSAAITRGVLEASLDLIIVIDDFGRILEINSAAEEKLGWHRDEVIGRCLAETIVPPEQVIQHIRGITRYRQERQGRVLGQRIEMEAMRRDQTRMPVELMIQPIPVEGRTYFAGYMRDLTKQHQREAELANLARFPSENPNPVLRVSKHGELVYANEPSRCFLDTWGVEVGGTVPSSIRKLVDIALTREAIQHDELKCGDTFFELKIAPVLQEQYCNIYGQDVTKRELAEESLTQRVQELDLLKRRSDAMSDLAGFLHAAISRRESFEILEHIGKKIFPYSSGTLHVLTDGTFEKKAQWGDELNANNYAFESCWSARRANQHTVNSDDSLRCDHLHPNVTGSTCVPISISGRLEAILTLAQATSEIDHSVPKFALGVAELMQLSLSNLELRERLQRDALVDPMTGLNNRRYIEQIGSRIIDRAKGSETSVALIMLDLDHFKSINDSFGHEVGDFVLRSVSDVLRNSVRAGDILCRYGGEEFIAVLIGADEERAFERAERLRESVASLSLNFEGSLIENVTISQGVAIYPKHGDDFSQLLNLADSALYEAKEAGRNQTCLVSFQARV